MKIKTLLSFGVLGLALASNGLAYKDVDVKQRKPVKKVIRTRMPPSMFQEWVQNEFKAWSGPWQTSWQTFVVDDQDPDEYLVIARSQNRPWAFGEERKDCEKPENYEQLKSEVQAGGSPLHVDVVLGIKKKRSFFRYPVTVYEPMYPFWKSPCYVWNLPPGSLKDPFYSKNYNLAVYSDNLQENVYELVSDLSNWRPPKKVKRIFEMKGRGQELVGGEAELLTDEEKKLPVEEQEKILKKRQKEQEKEDKKAKKKGAKEAE